MRGGREWGRVHARFWQSRDVASLGEDAKLAALYLMAGPHTSSAGLFYLPAAYLAADLRWETSRAEAALAALSRPMADGRPFVAVDPETRWVWMPSFLAWNPVSNPNHAAHVLALLEEAPPGRLLLGAAEAAAEAHEWKPKQSERLEAIATACRCHRDGIATASDTHTPWVSGEREQEQEQEIEEELEEERVSVEARVVGLASLDLVAAPPTTPKPRHPARAAEVTAVFAHYRAHHPRSFPTPDPKSKEWRKIHARLQEGYTVEDLCLAIDGCHRTPHNLGENDRGQKYLGLELIVRDGSQVTRFREAGDGPGAAVLSEREQKSKRAADSWLERSGSDGA